MRLDITHALNLTSTNRLCYKRGQFTNGLLFIKTAQDLLNEEPPKTSLQAEWGDKAIEAMRLHHQHACICSEIGDFGVSLTHWKTAKQHYDDLSLAGYPGIKNTDNESYLGGIGNSLNGLGRNKEAISYYLDAFKVVPPDDVDSPYQVNICRTRWADGQLDEAAARLCELIKLREIAKGEKDDTSNFV